MNARSPYVGQPTRTRAEAALDIVLPMLVECRDVLDQIEDAFDPQIDDGLAEPPAPTRHTVTISDRLWRRIGKALADANRALEHAKVLGR